MQAGSNEICPHKLAGEAGAGCAVRAERVGVAAAQVEVAQQGRMQQRLNEQCAKRLISICLAHGIM